MALALLGGCAGNGEGLNSQGEPIGSGGSSAPLTADFDSIQDNVFTPICTRCHSGAAAPEGLELDATHSYALLVGVPSAEVPGLERVKPGDPDSSYLIQKLEGAAGIVGVRMPFGGPYLPQSTIDVIRQWISDGAQPSSAAAAGSARMALSALAPRDGAVLERAPAALVIAFSREPDFSLVNASTIWLERLAPEDAVPVRAQLAPASGNPATILLRPQTPLAAGAYRLSVRGTGPAAIADLGGTPLGADSAVRFSIGGEP